MSNEYGLNVSRNKISTSSTRNTPKLLSFSRALWRDSTTKCRFGVTSGINFPATRSQASVSRLPPRRWTLRQRSSRIRPSMWRRLLLSNGRWQNSLTMILCRRISRRRLSVMTIRVMVKSGTATRCSSKKDWRITVSTSQRSDTMKITYLLYVFFLMCMWFVAFRYLDSVTVKGKGSRARLHGIGALESVAV